MSLEAILSSSLARELLSTSLSTAEIRTFPADVRARSLWSARTNYPPYVAKIADVLDRLLGGEINQASARNELQGSLEEMSYDPAEGFADAPDPEIPPAEPGTLRDLSSSHRINLMLETQEELVFGRGQKIAGLTRVETWPAWELIRVRSSRVPRDWPARWKKAADAVGWVGVAKETPRMIALKTSPIWQALGSSGLFKDALDTDHPPFAFSSGKGWEEMRLKEIQDFEFGGGPGNETPAQRPFNADLKVSVKKLPPDLVEAVKKDLAAELEGSDLRYQEELDRVRKEYLARSPAMARRLREEAAKNRIRNVLFILNRKVKAS